MKVGNNDDVSSSTGLFFSPKLYKELIKPFEMKVGKAVAESGMILEHHLCGKCEDLIPDIIERGATIWQTAQSMNDLAGIEKKYGDRLLIHGGWDSYGPHNDINATEDQMRAEVRRCIDSYAQNGHYALMPIVLGEPENPNTQRRKDWVADECRAYSEKLFK